jgi:hypothetical protein
MPSELARLLHETAPQPSPGLDPDKIWTAGRRRRRRRQVALGVAVIAIVGLAAAGTAWLVGPESNRVVTAGGDLVTYDDPAYNLTVKYPASWRRATTTLTPNLGDPVEILSLGTADLPVGGESCAHFPVAALEAMRTTDAFITVQERLSAEAAGLAPGQPWDEATGFPPRPDQFPPSDSKDVSEVVDCLGGPAVFDHWWFAFNDAGRGFHVLVAIGTQASEQTRAETWQILESLEFDSQRRVVVPTLEGLTLDQAEAALQEAGLRGGPIDGDPTAPDAVVVAQEPPADLQIPAGDAVGLRTALVTAELCDVLRRLTDFSDGADWNLSVEVLQEVTNLADPALRSDTQRVMDHIMGGADTPDQNADRALDRLAILGEPLASRRGPDHRNHLPRGVMRVQDCATPRTPLVL